MGLEDWVVDETGGILHLCKRLREAGRNVRHQTSTFDWWVIYDITVKEIHCVVCNKPVPSSVIDAARLAGSDGVAEWDNAILSGGAL